MTAVNDASAQGTSPGASDEELDLAPTMPQLPPIVLRKSRSESQLSYRILQENTYVNLAVTPKEAFRLWGVMLDTTLLNECEAVVAFKA